MFETLLNTLDTAIDKYAFRAIKDYDRQRKNGLDPVFHAKDIALPHETDYWN